MKVQHQTEEWIVLKPVGSLAEMFTDSRCSNTLAEEQGSCSAHSVVGGTVITSLELLVVL